ncbi:MAG: GHKL domain-containing protein [Lachnospiraceae bacterium]|nr:GHKL domain-containing protein [Lachnospiraceae bacterium]
MLSVYKLIWFVLFPVVFFAGRVGIKVSISMLSISVVAVIDLTINNILIFMNYPPATGYGWRDAVSIPVLALLAFCVRKHRKEIHEMICKDDVKINLSIPIISLMAFLWVGIMQYLFTEQPNNRLLLYAGFLSVIIAAMFILISVWSMYQRNKLTLMQERNEYQNRIIELNRRHVDFLLESEGELRSFRHDFKNHLLMIGNLAKESDDTAVADYIDGIYGKYDFIKYVNTNNRVADIFVNKLIQEFKNDETFEYTAVGRFPDNMPIDYVDMSILMSNLTDNVAEAFNKVSGRKQFDLEISHYKNHVFIDMRNSAAQSDANLVSDKKQPGHGLGIGKIRETVEKYDGSCEWIYKDGCMNVRIEMISEA